MDDLRQMRLSELRVRLSAVVDITALESIGIPREALLRPLDYTLGQELGSLVASLGHEGMLVPSASGLGDNLIIYPRNLRQPSLIIAVAYHDLDEVYYVGS